MIGEGSMPEFDYTKLNDIKPALIAEATANARESAAQFAEDSGSRLGGIRSANQGVVTINDRDQGSPQVKKVRVVRSEEHTSELQSLMRNSYAVFCLKKKITKKKPYNKLKLTQQIY